MCVWGGGAGEGGLLWAIVVALILLRTGESNKMK